MIHTADPRPYLPQPDYGWLPPQPYLFILAAIIGAALFVAWLAWSDNE